MFRLSGWTKLALFLALAAFVWWSASPFTPGVANAAPLAATAVGLGTADSFAVLAGSGITDSNPPAGLITGDVGLSPAAGTLYTGLTSAQVSGTIYAVDATGPDGVVGNNPGLLTTAKNDLVTAYNNAAGQTPDGQVGDLGGQTLTPGVYEDNNAPDSMAITAGTKILTLNALGDANAVFIFKSGSTLVTAAGSQVNLINGARACNVFWQVTSSATLGVGTTFKGNILALASITDNGGSTVEGRLLARDAAVTLNNTTIAKPTCAVVPPEGDTTVPICQLTGVIKGPPKQIKVTVQDTGSGIATITVLKAINNTVSIPPLTSGTNSPVVVTATKINQSQSSTLQLEVKDVAGKVTICDPVDTTLTIGKKGKPVVETFTGLPQAESKVRIMNGAPGLTGLGITVNGKKLVIRNLADNADQTIDVARAMKAGNINTITLEGRGEPGSSAWILISD